MTRHRYDPPYDSPIEDVLAYELVKVLDDSVELATQVEMRTQWGTFRPDFVMTKGSKVVAIECDGREFHNSYRDFWRDMLLIGSGRVDVIYRFPGAALMSRATDPLYVASVLDPELFHARGVGNLRTLVSDPLKQDWVELRKEAARERRFLEWNSYWYEGDGEEYRPLWHGLCSRRARPDEAGRTPYEWQYFKFAMQRGRCSLDDLIAAWESGGQVR